MQTRPCIQDFHQDYSIVYPVDQLRDTLALTAFRVPQSLLKQQLVNSLHYGQVPNLVELTYRAYEVILCTRRICVFSFSK